MAKYKGKSKEIENIADIYWGTPDNEPPPDTPICGFDGSRCKEDPSKYYIFFEERNFDVKLDYITQSSKKCGKSAI